jgi:hypothetical protein
LHLAETSNPYSDFQHNFAVSQREVAMMAPPQFHEATANEDLGPPPRCIDLRPLLSDELGMRSLNPDANDLGAHNADSLVV